MTLKQIRKKRGWSQAELARRAGLNGNTICQIEVGRLFPFDVQQSKIAKALSMGVNQIDFGQPTNR